MTRKTQDRWPGIALLAALALHAWSLGRHDLPHLLWSCHVASLVLALGVLARSRTAVATGLLFHLAIGFPAWLVEVILTRGTFGGVAVIGRVLATSVLVHTLPIAVGLLYLGFSALPRKAVPLAWLLQLVMVPIARWWTPPALNVNLAHAVWPQVAGSFQRFWLFQALSGLVCLTSLVVVTLLWNSVVAWRGRPRPGGLQT